MESFSEINLSAPIVTALAELGFTKPTPIQAMALPLLIGDPTNFLGMAATGTGKTAAFAIPLLEKIDTTNRSTQAIVLCPTRELALQTTEKISALGKHKRVQTVVIYGGTGYNDQIRGLQRTPHIIVATPGRLLDHLERGNLNLGSVNTVVLDEADEMISMGFKDAIETLLRALPEGACHTWLFAATMSPDLRRVADAYLKNPKIAQINRTEMLSGTVRQIFYVVRDKNKPKALCKILDMADEFYGLVFCQTKATVTGVTDHLRSRGYKVDSIHGDKTQMERERTLRAFKARQITVLVCSDVAARGIDVDDLTHVINFSLPMELDSYIHRIGRTGRNGKMGLALNLVGPTHLHLVDRIERRTKTPMEEGTLPTFDDIIGKRLCRLLEDFKKLQSHPSAKKVLEGEWKETLDGLSKVDIAERLLLLAMPQIFDDREKAEEIFVSEDEQRPHHRRFSRSDGPRGDRRGGGRGRPPMRNETRGGGSFRRSSERPGTSRPHMRSENRGTSRPHAPVENRGTNLTHAPTEKPGAGTEHRTREAARSRGETPNRGRPPMQTERRGGGHFGMRSEGRGGDRPRFGTRGGGAGRPGGSFGRPGGRRPPNRRKTVEIQPKGA